MRPTLTGSSQVNPAGMASSVGSGAGASVGAGTAVGSLIMGSSVGSGVAGAQAESNKAIDSKPARISCIFFISSSSKKI
jgi:hypothetical protein